MKRRRLLQAGLAAGGPWILPRPLFSQKAAGAFHVHPSGHDANPGTKDKPLRTLAAAAQRVNAATGAEAVSIILSEGVYALNEPALFKPANRAFTRDARLTVRAAVLPDDAGWSPRSMPVLVHTMPLSPDWLGRPDPFGGVSYGMQFETSHVTVQGLKFLGTPHLEEPAPKVIRRVYPIAREGAELDDLEVRQCLFTGNREVAELHCGILARGNGVIVDHCVFHGCKITVVYWTGQAKGCAMRNTFVSGATVTGAWLCAIADDFDFRNNVISSSFSAVLFQGKVGNYKLTNSLFAGNKTLFGSGMGPAVNFKALPPSTLQLPPSSKVTDAPVAVELNQAKRGYLHVAGGTPGSEIPAGLFASRV